MQALYTPLPTFTRWLTCGFLSAHAAAPLAVEHTLAKHGFHRELRPQGLTLRCTRGCVWLTQDGEEQDIVLEAGQNHVCTTGSRLLVHALEASAFSTRRA